MDRRRASPDAISAWLIPRFPPPIWRKAALTLAAVLAAMGLRIAVLGLTSGVGATLTFFPAMILVTLYAGWRWGLIPIAAGGVFAWWLWSGHVAPPTRERHRGAVPGVGADHHRRGRRPARPA
jgi:hypothetical protein